MTAAHQTWILTGSLENFRINVERGFDVIGFKERRLRQAEEFEPGDEIVFYVTGVQAFGGIARVKSEMFEDRTPIWPGYKGARPAKGKKPEPYPWRVEAEPVLILPEKEFVPAEELEDMRELKMQCQVSGFYSHWRLTEAQGGTFTEVEMGVEEIEAKRGIQGRVIGALHTKNFLRRAAEGVLDNLPDVFRGSRGDRRS